VQSSVGHGSTFSIYLPRVDSPAEAGSEASAPVPHGNGERICWSTTRKRWWRSLPRSSSIWATSPSRSPTGATALAEFEADPERYDALITDEVMSGLSGTELARSVRRHRADLPIVLVSGYIGPLIDRARRDGGRHRDPQETLHSRDIAAALARVLQRS